jgi:hypothetical protein
MAKDRWVHVNATDAARTPEGSVTVTISTHDPNRAAPPQGLDENQSIYITEPGPLKRKPLPRALALSSGITAGFVYLPADAGRGDLNEDIVRAWAKDMDNLGNDIEHVIGTARERHKDAE